MGCRSLVAGLIVPDCLVRRHVEGHNPDRRRLDERLGFVIRAMVLGTVVIRSMEHCGLGLGTLVVGAVVLRAVVLGTVVLRSVVLGLVVTGVLNCGMAERSHSYVAARHRPHQPCVCCGVELGSLC